LKASREKITTRKSIGDRPAVTKLGEHCPDTGDLIWIDLDPTKGHEQRGRPPALVLSPRSYNERSGLCVACAITNQAKGFRFEVAVPAGQPVTGVVLSDQLRTLSWPTRNTEIIGRAPANVINDVREKIAALLDID
jgi:mRNA interferase MazF